LLGPFLAPPKPGNHLGFVVFLPRLAGWLASCSFYMLVARLIALGHWFERLGVCAFILCFGWILAAGLKYVGYSMKLRRVSAQLVSLMTGAGLPAGEARKLVDLIVRNFVGNIEKTKAALGKTSLTPEAQALVAKTVEEKLKPLLEGPSLSSQRRPGIRQRFLSELSRSFVLGLFTFIWFFVVPMPGLLVFTAPGDYRISISPAGVLTFSACVVAGVFAAACLSLLLETWEKHRLRDNGLAAAIDKQYRAFQVSLAKGRLSHWEKSKLYALFTDVQTYFDQRSYAYARRSLEHIARTLDRT
jgi:hypothetical protein